MKVVDKYVMKGLIGPYVLSFLVAEFVLVIQFLWKYLDDIIGKGCGFFTIMEVLFYYSITIIPLAVPITVLISSVMVFGNMSEKYELSSLKSAGVSLTRIMRGGLIMALLTAAFSLLASNFLKPKAQFAYVQRFYNIKKQKPTLVIEEGIFNKDFRNYVIRVGKKDPNGRDIQDIMIYDHTNPNADEINVVVAKKGEMFTSENGQYFVMNLFDGEHYKESKRKLVSKREKENDPDKKSSYPFMRTKFKEWTKAFDMSEFEFDSDFNFTRNKHDLLNTKQLLFSIDSLKKRIVSNVNENKVSFLKYKDLGRDSEQIKRKKQQQAELARKKLEAKRLKSENKSSITAPKKIERNPDIRNFKVNLDTLTNYADRFRAVAVLKYQNSALSQSKAIRDRANSVELKVKTIEHSVRRYQLRLHQMYSWAVVCIIFLFIGAPLGSIIRKGGYGYPLLIAIIFFMIFIILQILGDKLSRGGSMSSWLAAWLPCIVLFPFAFYVTRQAMKDSRLFSGDRLYSLWSKISIRKK